MNWQTCCEVDRLERYKKRLKQADITQATGISQSTINHWENTQHVPRLDAFILFLDELGLELKIIRKKEKE